MSVLFINGSAPCTIDINGGQVNRAYINGKLVHQGVCDNWNIYKGRYLTFVAQESGTFRFTNPLPTPENFQYSLDNGSTWTTLASETDTPTLQTGESIMWKGSGYTQTSTHITFSSTGKYKVEGNVLSLLYDDDFQGKTSLSGRTGIFQSLFSNSTGVTDARNLVLPATELTDNCYQNMFYRCTSLTKAPSKLPAVTLKQRCYYSMFQGCTSLSTAPELLAETLGKECCENMFNGCTSLVTPPVLPATTLAEQCYVGMFYNCTSLATAPELPATSLTTYCYFSMFGGCTSLMNVPSRLPATELASYCYGQMFMGCTGLTTAPELPATTLTGHCYEQMFHSCYSLTRAPMLPATRLAPYYTYNQMFYACTSLNYIECLATSYTTSDNLDNWVYGVAATGTFVKASGASFWSTGPSGIPVGWTVIEE